jgi:hypothetical protein
MRLLYATLVAAVLAVSATAAQAPPAARHIEVATPAGAEVSASVTGDATGRGSTLHVSLADGSGSLFDGEAKCHAKMQSKGGEHRLAILCGARGDTMMRLALHGKATRDDAGVIHFEGRGVGGVKGSGDAAPHKVKIPAVSGTITKSA